MSTDAAPIIAAKASTKVELEEGKTYFWCSCGRSSKQPFCDGSHSGTGMVPTKFTAEKSGPAFLCQCKASGKAPFCDGSHSRLGERGVGDPVA